MNTEAEAKTKWCPFAKVLLSNWYEDSDRIPQPVCNRIEGMSGEEIAHDNSILGDSNLCVGSACMAWRWNVIDSTCKPEAQPVKRHGGYCGLAGKP